MTRTNIISFFSAVIFKRIISLSCGIFFLFLLWLININLFNIVFSFNNFFLVNLRFFYFSFCIFNHQIIFIFVIFVFIRNLLRMVLLLGLFIKLALKSWPLIRLMDRVFSITHYF